MAWGIQTWDAKGLPNNYGLKPVSVVGTIKLAKGQVTGSYSFAIPAGTKVGFVPALDKGSTGVARRVTASGNTITIQSANSPGYGNYSASECEIIVFLENA